MKRTQNGVQDDVMRDAKSSLVSLKFKWQWCHRHALFGSIVGQLCYWFRLRNDLYCVEWGVKLYSLTHSCATDGIL